MKKSLYALFIILVVYINHTNAQDFLEIKYSINDITRQREKFKNEKIKSVAVKTSYGENVYYIDVEGKIITIREKATDIINVSYSYDSKGNLVTVEYRLAPNSYEYDSKGNVIRKSGEENTYFFSYDSDNRLVKENVESNLESCPFEKTVYDGNLLIEKIYPCCEGFRIYRHVYEYSDSGNLLRISTYSKNCKPLVNDINNNEELTQTEEYFYNDKSNLPYKMTKDSEEINFSYEYY